MSSLKRLSSGSAILCLFLTLPLGAQDVRINLPKRSKPTPVQKNNQDGVKALKKGNVDKAKQSFYKAYLLDPNDPFTLNNLGYVAELEGEIERATRYYDLAATNSSDAVISNATVDSLKGKHVSEVAGRAADKGPLQVNRLNVQAIGLLLKDRSIEAQRVLDKALAIQPDNPFTLNNLGYAYEKQGELDTALKYYTRAADLKSDERIIVAVNKDWRRKEISDVAERNADNVRKQIRNDSSVSARVARLNLRGVSALNKNDRGAARRFFTEASKLDPENAFTLNNMGYLAELDGDRESANYYYDRAQKAEGADRRVGVATRREAEGRVLERVADTNEITVAQKMEAEQAARRTQGRDKPVALKRRDGTVVETPQVQQEERPHEKSEQPR